jgi:hypothetical protein
MGQANTRLAWLACLGGCSLLSYQDAITFPPKGGDPQGWCESNAHYAGFGGRSPIRWVIPM